ncbi:hypothetical protein MTP99_013838 [Tenebrio molitor]|nr:hypothetical protein MTP99_013838 [Tenebrio molitor]
MCAARNADHKSQDKENPGGKVGRLQEPCEFPESANILSSTSVYINEEFSKPTISVCNQEDKENAGYENFDNANVAARVLWILEWPSSTEYAMCGVTRVHRCPAISTAIHYSAALRDGQEAVLTDDSVSPATRRHPLGDQQMYPSSILT